MPMKLHVVAGSHPCACVEAALGIKAVAYRRVELPVLVHRVAQRLRYGEPTVPGLSLEDGENVVGSVAIPRRLEELVPEPPLYPGDAAGGERVEAAPPGPR
jgi:glutathione S-transferase